MKIVEGSAHNLNNCTNVFPHDNHQILTRNRSALCVLPILSHRILKRHVLKGPDLIILIYLCFVKDTLKWKWMCWPEESNDHYAVWCHCLHSF